MEGRSPLDAEAARVRLRAQYLGSEATTIVPSFRAPPATLIPIRFLPTLLLNQSFFLDTRGITLQVSWILSNDFVLFLLSMHAEMQ